MRLRHDDVFVGILNAVMNSGGALAKMLIAVKPELHSDIREVFQELLGVKGSLVVGLGNWQTASCLAFDCINSPIFPSSKVVSAVEGNSEVIRAKLNVAKSLNFNENIEQIIIALKTQWHVIRVLSAEGYFIYLAMDRASSNVASASLKLSIADERLSAKLVNA